MGLSFNALSGQFDLVGGSSGSTTNSFSIIQPDSGTSPTASSSTDTLTVTSVDQSLTVVGTASTKTVNFQTTLEQSRRTTTAFAIGHTAGAGASGAHTFSIGFNANSGSSSSAFSVYIGSNTGLSTTSGDQNTVVGQYGLYGNNAGGAARNNIAAFGYGTLFFANGAFDNTTAIGSNAGGTYALYPSCTLVGQAADTAANNQTNSGAFGNGAISPRANFIQLGNTSVEGIGHSGYAEMTEIAKPATPASGFNRLYFKSDHKLYRLDSTGTETLIG